MEAMSTETAQAWIDQLVCPECKAVYPERTVSYQTAASLANHRKFKHKVGADTQPAAKDADQTGKPQRDADGTFHCPECGQSGLESTLALGRHRYIKHGVRGLSYGARYYQRQKQAKLAAKPHTAKPETVKPPIAKPEPKSEAAGMVAVYLYGKVEGIIQTYAEQNGLAARPLFRQVAEMLKGAS